KAVVGLRRGLLLHPGRRRLRCRGWRHRHSTEEPRRDDGPRLIGHEHFRSVLSDYRRLTDCWTAAFGKARDIVDAELLCSRRLGDIIDAEALSDRLLNAQHSLDIGPQLLLCRRPGGASRN